MTTGSTENYLAMKIIGLLLRRNKHGKLEEE